MSRHSGHTGNIAGRMQKLIFLQWLRGIAAVLVVWMHCIYLASDRKLPAFQVNWEHLYQFGSVGVDIFFVISGFIVTLSAARTTSVKSFLANRARQIWPLYIVATLVMLFISPRPVSGLRALASMMFLVPLDVHNPMPVLGPGWSLSFEMAFYTMIGVGLGWRSAT